MVEERDESIVGPIVLASIGAAVLGAVLALVLLAWLNDGKLEFQTKQGIRSTSGANGEEVDTEIGAFGGLATPGAGGAVELSDILARLEALEVEVAKLSEEVSMQSDAPAGGADDEPADASETAENTETAGGEGQATATAPGRRETPEATDEAEPTEPMPTATDAEPTATRGPTRVPPPTPTLKILP